MKEWIMDLNTWLFSFRFETAVSVWERDRDRETKDVDTDWWRTAILTHNFLTTLILYSGPYLALLLLSWCGGTASLCALTGWNSHDFVSQSVWLCDWPSDMGTYVYIISQCQCVLVVNPFDLHLAVNQYELLTPTHRCLPVYTAGTWWLCQRSICNSI